MKRIVVIFLLMVSCAGYTQSGNFLFIEELGRQPFYLRMGDQSYSSSAGGHLILAGLKDSTYNFFIGFPRTKVPEQLFAIQLKGDDRGFELKNVDGEWQLLDWQSGELKRPLRKNIIFAGGTKKTDSYTSLMAGIVNDTTVLYSTIVSLSPTDTVTVKPIVANKPVAATDTTANVVKNGAVYDKRDIIRYGTENIIEGKLMIYIDRSGPVSDTIRLVIPRL